MRLIINNAQMANRLVSDCCSLRNVMAKRPRPSQNFIRREYLFQRGYLG